MERGEIEMRGGGVALAGWQNKSVSERVDGWAWVQFDVLVAQSYPQFNGLDLNVLVLRYWN
jgi:hypothetical protein